MKGHIPRSTCHPGGTPAGRPPPGRGGGVSRSPYCRQVQGLAINSDRPGQLRLEAEGHHVTGQALQTRVPSSSPWWVARRPHGYVPTGQPGTDATDPGCGWARRVARASLGAPPRSPQRLHLGPPPRPSSPASPGRSAKCGSQSRPGVGLPGPQACSHAGFPRKNPRAPGLCSHPPSQGQRPPCPHPRPRPPGAVGLGPTLPPQLRS